MNYKEAVIVFVILMIIIFIVDYFVINKRKLKNLNAKGVKNKKKKSIGEIDYLVVKFGLNPKKINKKRVILDISIINSFIISIVSSVIMLMPLKLVWQMLIAFALLFGLIYSLYEIYGRHLKKIEVKSKRKPKNNGSKKSKSDFDSK